MCQNASGHGRTRTSQLLALPPLPKKRNMTHDGVCRTHILKPCIALWHLTLPSWNCLSTQVVLMGSAEHSPHGTRVMTGRSRREASCGSDPWNVSILLISAFFPTAISAGEIGSVSVYSQSQSISSPIVSSRTLRMALVCSSCAC